VLPWVSCYGRNRWKAVSDWPLAQTTCGPILNKTDSTLTSREQDEAANGSISCVRELGKQVNFVGIENIVVEVLTGFICQMNGNRPESLRAYQAY
jgi:hypothetical protein